MPRSAAHRSTFRLICKTAILAGVCAAALVADVYLYRSSAPVVQNPHLLPVMAEHPVTLNDKDTVFVQKHEVTVAEWNRCFDAGHCDLKLRSRSGWNPERTPATGLNQVDVGQYLAWINHATGLKFRLPTMSEWTRMALEVMPEKPEPIFTDPSLTWASAYLTDSVPKRALKETGSFPETKEGIADLSGSVWEWTQDCYSGSGEARIPVSCPAYYVAGEHMAVVPFLTRDPARGGCAVGSPPAHLGLRLISDHPVPEQLIN